jgi:hypothetical protein
LGRRLDTGCQTDRTTPDHHTGCRGDGQRDQTERRHDIIDSLDPEPVDGATADNRTQADPAEAIRIQPTVVPSNPVIWPRKSAR